MNTAEKIHALRTELHEHNRRYYIEDAPVISDREFDEMLAELQALEDANPALFDANSPTQRVGGAVTKTFNTIAHEQRMYSLDNSYNRQDLLDWEQRMCKNLGVETSLLTSIYPTVDHGLENRFGLLLHRVGATSQHLSLLFQLFFNSLLEDIRF